MVGKSLIPLSKDSMKLGRSIQLARRIIATGLLGALCATLGCGPSGPPRFAVSGQVTYDGQPVTNGSISFAPADSSEGKGVAADLIDGHYEFPRKQGPTAGTYQVWIEAQQPSGKKIPSEDGSPPTDQLVQYIPAVYNSRSTLQAEITEDREDLDFNLEKVEPARRR